MRIGWRQPAAGAARPGVGREQRSAAGAELVVCKSGCRNFCRGVGDGTCVALRSLSLPGGKQGREGAQAVHAAVLGQPKPVLPSGQPEGEVRENACHAVVVWRTYCLWQVRPAYLCYARGWHAGDVWQCAYIRRGSLLGWSGLGVFRSQCCRNGRRQAVNG